MGSALCSNRCNEHGQNQKDHNKNILKVNTNIIIISIMTMSILTIGKMTMSTVEGIIK